MVRRGPPRAGPGAVWCREPQEVNVYDFLTDAERRAVPSGISERLSGRGHIGVGVASDTPAFAVAALRAGGPALAAGATGGRMSC